MHRQAAQTAKPLSLAERKASVAKIAACAPPKVRAGIELIDFRELTARELEIGETLARRLRDRQTRQPAKAA